MNDRSYNRVGAARIGQRQIDELIGLARGLGADGVIDEHEAAFLQSWLAANSVITQNPLIHGLYARVNDMLADGVADGDERADLLAALNAFSNRDIELGEPLKSTTLLLSDPAPTLAFAGERYCFTGTFNFGNRAACERAAKDRGADVGALTLKTNVLVIGIYATESWKHSSFGLKILKAAEYRDRGAAIAIVSETHWAAQL